MDPVFGQALGLVMFGAVLVLLMIGYPAVFTLAGTGLLFALLGLALAVFDLRLLAALPLRLVGLMENDLLQAVPLFIYIGVMLQVTALSRDLLEGMGALFGRLSGGLGISTLLLGALM